MNQKDVKIIKRISKISVIAIMLSCLLPVSFAFATEAISVLSIKGTGANPNSIIMLNASGNNIKTQADKNGAFAFNNLSYSALKPIAFDLHIPERGGAIITPKADLSFTYKPKSSRIAVKGNIGRAGSISLFAGNNDDVVTHVAGNGGDISFAASSNTPVSSGVSQVMASITGVTEICCPRIIVPSKPINLIIASNPIKESKPNFFAPVVKKPEFKSLQEQPKLPIEPKPQNNPTSQQPNKYWVAPQDKNKEDNNKPKIPYIVQGVIELPEITHTIDDKSFAISFSQSDYDNSWQGGFRAIIANIRNAITQSAVMMGTYIDSSNTLTSIRKINNQQVNTYKDYAPSETICKFGTLSRSIAKTQNNVDASKNLFAKIINDTNARRVGTLFQKQQAGMVSRMHDFQTKYCKETDNNNFLKGYCNVTANVDLTINRDVDFTRVFDTPLTLNVDLVNAQSNLDTTSLVSLFRNLTYISPYDNVNSQDKNAPENISVNLARVLNASRGVAGNSFASLVGEKVKGASASSTYMLEVLKKLGLSDADAKKLIGESPSYYAQMEIMTKKLYQDPAFFANLYDSPQNVDRQKVAMAAIALQQDRDFLESLRRREMLLSSLLSLKLQSVADDANASGVAAAAPTKN